MALGSSTAPVLYGIADEPDLRELVERKFSKKRDAAGGASSPRRATAQ